MFHLQPWQFLDIPSWKLKTPAVLDLISIIYNILCYSYFCIVLLTFRMVCCCWWSVDCCLLVHLHAGIEGGCECTLARMERLGSQREFMVPVPLVDGMVLRFHGAWFILGKPIWLAVSNILYFAPYLGKWSNLTTVIFFKWVETTNWLSFGSSVMFWPWNCWFPDMVSGFFRFLGISPVTETYWYGRRRNPKRWWGWNTCKVPIVTSGWVNHSSKTRQQQQQQHLFPPTFSFVPEAP